jgi:hypothetical protein
MTAIPPIADAEIPGFSAFFDSLLAQSGGTVMKPGGKAGNLHTTGPFAGMTSEQGRMEAQRLWQSMPPTARQQYMPAQGAAIPQGGTPDPRTGGTPAPSAAPAAAPQQSFAPPPKGFSGLEALYQMNPQLRRTQPPSIFPATPAPTPAPGATPQTAAPAIAGPPAPVPPPAASIVPGAIADAANGIQQRGTSGSVTFNNGASITAPVNGQRTLTTPTGGTGAATPIAPGHPRPPAIFTNMETGQKQSLAQATGGRATLPSSTTPAIAAPATPPPAKPNEVTSFTPVQRVGNTIYDATAPEGQRTTPASRVAATAPTVTPPQGAAASVAISPAVNNGATRPQVPAGPPPAITAPAGPPPRPRLISPLQQGKEAVQSTLQNTAMGIKTGTEKAITGTAGAVSKGIDKTADKIATAAMWPFTPRPVK